MIFILYTSSSPATPILPPSIEAFVFNPSSPICMPKYLWMCDLLLKSGPPYGYMLTGSSLSLFTESNNCQ